MTGVDTAGGDRSFEPGAMIDDRYEIVSHLGEGGFATVYKARQVLMDRLVALKVLRDTRMSSATFEQRFAHEAKLAGSLRHPNVVTIYDFGFAGPAREPYIVMEYLEGHDLQTEMRTSGPLRPARALPLFCDVLDALGEGHEAGVVHKDLKPANLFLVAPGSPRESLMVLDFGVARAYGTEDERMTGTGQYFGTPQYLAPEYIESQTVTPAIDVYQIGLILIEVLTGCSAIEGDTPYRLLAAHVDGDVTIVDTLRDSPIGPLLAKATARDPARRYRDGAAFRRALLEVDPAEVVLDVSYEAVHRPALSSTAGVPLFAASAGGSVSDALATTVAGDVEASVGSGSGSVSRSPSGSVSSLDASASLLASAKSAVAAREARGEGRRRTPLQIVALAVVLLVVVAGAAFLSSGIWSDEVAPKGRPHRGGSHPNTVSTGSTDDVGQARDAAVAGDVGQAVEVPDAARTRAADGSTEAGVADVRVDVAAVVVVPKVRSKPRAPRVCWRYGGNPSYVVPTPCRQACVRADGRLKRSAALSASCDRVMTCRTSAGCQPP